MHPSQRFGLLETKKCNPLSVLGLPNTKKTTLAAFWASPAQEMQPSQRFGFRAHIIKTIENLPLPDQFWGWGGGLTVVESARGQQKAQKLPGGFITDYSNMEAEGPDRPTMR